MSWGLTGGIPCFDLNMECAYEHELQADRLFWMPPRYSVLWLPGGKQKRKPAPHHTGKTLVHASVCRRREHEPFYSPGPVTQQCLI